MPNSNQTLSVANVRAMLEQRMANIDRYLSAEASTTEGGTVARALARGKREAYEDTLVLLDLLPADAVFVVTAEKPNT